MSSETTRVTSQPDDAAAVPDGVEELTARIRHFGPWSLVKWRPPGGYATGSHARLTAALDGLERKLTDGQ
ncbi:hypothetical protein C9F11_10315 [Streptomyces sp. YIM 121038]|uniref:hypothetical protein n=1 Tax=Streptomyces sp. YIM 121038 TaxID=2136401 RepID=UPI0011107F5B|nr:hypothetical protein [Streptomyces sp. YIM 121038]QCX75743.1 hypothetical protein C9F11_10315 [Streptomyces sp. YIM 121038]